MPKASGKSVWVTDETQYQEEFNEIPVGCSNVSYNETYASENESQENLDVTHESSSDQEVAINPKPSTSRKVHHSRSRSVQMPSQQQTYMPYIEGPKMNWSVDDGLYNRFIKWKIRCENILDCELAKSAKKLLHGQEILAWTNISHTIWQKYEELCKPQGNELRARFDLLTSIKQDQMSVDEWYNKVQTQIGLCNYPQERDIFLVLFE